MIYVFLGIAAWAAFCVFCLGMYFATKTMPRIRRAVDRLRPPPLVREVPKLVERVVHVPTDQLELINATTLDQQMLLVDKLQLPDQDKQEIKQEVRREWIAGL